MLIAATILFIIAAILGMYLLSYVLRNRETPKGLAFTHGPIAAIGLILLIIYACLYSPSPWISILLFIIAAFGGFVMIFRDLTHRSLPKWLAVGHGLIAIIGFIVLLIFIIAHA